MQDEARRRIARDLHDGVGTELAVARMGVGGGGGQIAWGQTRSPRKKQVPAKSSEIIDRAIQPRYAACLHSCIRPCR